MISNRSYACLMAGAISLASTGAMAECSFTPALTTQTKCVHRRLHTGNPLRSFDISFVNAKRAEYYLADRSNAAIEVIDFDDPSRGSGSSADSSGSSSTARPPSTTITRDRTAS